MDSTSLHYVCDLYGFVPRMCHIECVFHYEYCSLLSVIFWFIVLPVLIESLKIEKQTEATEANESKPALTAREARGLLSVIAKYAKDAQLAGLDPVRRQDTANAITVSWISIHHFVQYP